MESNDISKKINEIAKLEANGELQSAGTLKQELFTNGVDYPVIEKMVKKAIKARARKDNGTYKADDKTTKDKNEAFKTGKTPKKPAAKKPVVKKPIAKKTTAKKPAARKPTGKKTAVKK